MKTIEERAKECSYKIYTSGVEWWRDSNSMIEFGQLCYKKGATEQKAIDEEVRLKKCDDMTEAEYNRETAFVDWYLENGKGMPAYSDAIEWARKEVINKACKWLKENVEGGVHPQSAYGFVNKFRKAMEE